MTQNHEYNAATVEEALQKATQELEIPEDELSYEVLDPGSAGFLGMGSRDARITIAVGSSDAESEAPSSEEPVAPREEAATDEHASSPPAPEEEDPSPLPTEDHAETPEAPEELLSEVEEFVSHSVEAMGLDARIDVYDADDFVAVDVASSETGLFIGQKGETIDALQYLLNVAVYKERPYAKRIVIDSEGYRQRRVEAVQGIAHRMARKAVREREPIDLPPMNTSERRVVHMFLKDNAKVTTASRGSGDSRRVTVSPN